MRSMATRFADTTALFELSAGTRNSRAAAKQALRPRNEVVSSDHVQREWKRILVAAVGSLIESVEQEPDLGSALARLGVGYGRAGAQRWRAAALIVGGSESFNATDTRIRGRQQLRTLDSTLRRSVGTLRTSSQCGLAVQQPREKPDRTWTIKDTCKRGEGICDHEDRIGRDAARWTAGAHALVASGNDSLAKLAKTALKMAANPEIRTGVNCYGRTGDLAIALDCRRGEVLVTTDASFDTMAPAMGFTVHRLPVK
jgi:hypothetical protein